MPKENCEKCEKEIKVELWVSNLLKNNSDIQIICKECDNNERKG